MVSCSDELAVHSCPLLCLQSRVAHLSSPKKPDLFPKKCQNSQIVVSRHTHKTCINKHSTDVITHQKHRYNTIPIFNKPVTREGAGMANPS